MRRGVALLGFLLASAASGQDPFGPSDPFESRFKTKPTFEIKFRVPEPGGEVRLTTKNPVHYEKDVYWEGSGEVTIEYQDVKITADRARYDFPTKTATLEGNVVIDQGPTRMSGTRAVFRVEEKTGKLEDATADLAPTYHVVAKSIEKIGPATYRIEKGIFTSCDLPNPEWSFYLSTAEVTLDDYARMRNVSFRAGPVPVLFTPWLVWPTKQDRASGFLVPGAGYNSNRGAYLGLTYYWVTGRSTDSTTQVDMFSKGGIGLGQELRWTPSLESAGIFQGYAIRDPEATACVPAEEEPDGGDGPCTTTDGRAGVFALREIVRWKARLDHVSNDLPYGFRGVLSIREYSDEEFLRDYERAFALSSSRQTLSRGFLTKNFGNDSVNLRVERSKTFYGTEVVQARLPSLEYSRRTSRVGRTPLYFALESSLSYLAVDRGPTLSNGKYGRADFRPILSLPWKSVPWLAVTAKGGGRWTGYTDSTDDARTQFTGETATRAYAEAGVALVGPSFSRIYEGKIGTFGRFKHVIEPRVDYEYISDVDDPLRFPVYDEVDTALGRNQIRYAVVNRLLARPADAKSGGATEIASLEIAQTHAFSPPQVPSGTTSFDSFPQRTGPIETALRIIPGALFQFDGRTAWDLDASQITAVSIATSVNWGANYVNATWFGSRPVAPEGGTASPPADQIRLAAGVDLSKSVRIDTQFNYDAQLNKLLEDRSLLTFNGSCYALFLEVRQLRLPPDTRRDYRLVINLKDVGQLLDVNGSLDTLFGSR